MVMQTHRLRHRTRFRPVQSFTPRPQVSRTLMKVDDGFNYQATLGSRDFSYAVSDFGQVIESFRFEDENEYQYEI